MHQPFGEGAVAEEGDRDGVPLLRLVGERAAERDRNACADDAVGAEHADRHVRDMHRAATAAAEPGIARQPTRRKKPSSDSPLAMA